MKAALFATLIVLSTQNFAEALPAPKPQEPFRFELMKCTSERHGTIWASFGRLMRSGEDTVTYFPTEIVVFSPDLTSRLLFPKFEDAFKIPTSVGPGRMSMKFDVPNGSKIRTHHLQIMQYDPRIDNAYVGNWSVTDSGDEKMGAVACSLD